MPVAESTGALSASIPHLAGTWLYAGPAEFTCAFLGAARPRSRQQAKRTGEFRNANCEPLPARLLGQPCGDALAGAPRLVYAAMWIVAPDNPGRAMATRSVRCIDNTLVNDVLSVGEIYEVMHIDERDGVYALSGLGRFTMARFKVVSAAEAGYWPSSRWRSPAQSPPKNR